MLFLLLQMQLQQPMNAITSINRREINILQISILSGSALAMYKALQNLVKHVGIETGETLRMCGLYPAQVMELDDKLGMIARSYRSNMVLLPELPDSTVELRMIS